MLPAVAHVVLKARLHKVEKSGNLHLVVAQPPPQNDALRDRLRRIGTPAHWHQDTWEWSYPLTVAAVLALRDVAKEFGLGIEYSPDLVEFARQQEQLDEYEQRVRLSIEKAIRTQEPLPQYPTNTLSDTKKPMRHQQVSYHWGLRTSSLVLAHDPGLGKSRSAIDIMGGWYRERLISPMQNVWLPQQGRWGVKGGVLVVTPKVMLRTWQEEMLQWQGATGVELAGTKEKKLKMAGTVAHAHIVNYESLRNVEGNEYSAIIADELHRLANHSQQTERMLRLAFTARFRIGLTGTLVSNSLESVFYQMLFIDGGRSLGASKTAFLEQYFNQETVAPGVTKKEPKEGALAAVSSRISRCAYFLKKEEVIELGDLPPKTHVPLRLEMSVQQRKYYNDLKKEAIAYIQDLEVTAEQAAAKVMKLRQVCQGFVMDETGQSRSFSNSKIDVLLDMLKTKLWGRKVAVWCTFTHEVDTLCRTLQAAGIGYVRLDGTVTNKKTRDQALKLWNTEPRIQVFVGQIQMGIGITLHANECQVPCYDCVYMSVDWSYTNWVQSQDRIHRIGQKFACTYTYLLAEDSVDWQIYQALRAKEGTAQAVHRQGKDFFLALLTEDTPNLAAAA